MTSPTDGRRLPGTTLLNVAPLLFSEHFVCTIVRPTIADLQSEYVAAGDSRAARLSALVRGYAAFWMVMAVAPFAVLTAPERAADASAGFAARHLASGVVLLTMLVFAGTMFEISATFVIIAGAVLAVVIHSWYDRHPSQTPAPSDVPVRTPQINFSSMDVAGNVGGLIFVVGTLLIVVLAVPMMLAILMAAAGLGALLAWRLTAWYRRHPNWGLPENRIVLR